MPVAELPVVIAAGTYHDPRQGAITVVDPHTHLRVTPAVSALRPRLRRGMWRRGKYPPDHPYG
ncbi:MAG: hypothetical protein ACRDQ4_22450 [Pseudonocardiaceae bacterium]